MTTPWSDRVDECREQFQTEHNENIRKEILEYVGETPVMEVGCGTAELRKHVDGGYIGVDFTPEFEPDVCADARDLPFEDGSVPTVVTKNVLQHIPEWKEAISECCRVASDRVVSAERSDGGETRRRGANDSGVLLRVFGEDELRDEFAGHGSVSVHPCPHNGMGVFVTEVAS